MSANRLVVAALALAAAAALLPASSARADFMDTAVLQGLDKVTARVSRIEVPVGGGTVTFGALEISADACYKRPPEETPESAAFLRIAEQRSGETPETIFSGWMFASSPALSALENAVYDVWVIDCISADTAASESSTGN
jgi:hypothetical protein